MPKIKLKSGEIKESDLLTLNQLHLRLGRGFSPRTMRKKIASGELQQGEHYFRTNGVSGMSKVYLPAIKQKLIDNNS